MGNHGNLCAVNEAESRLNGTALLRRRRAIKAREYNRFTMPAAASPLKIGVISDTHDLLRPQAREALAGVSHILHAGDICGADVLTALSEIAPVTAVRGNNDRGTWARTLQTTALIELGGCSIYM